MQEIKQKIQNQLKIISDDELFYFDLVFNNLLDIMLNMGLSFTDSSNVLVEKINFTNYGQKTFFVKPFVKGSETIKIKEKFSNREKTILTSEDYEGFGYKTDLEIVKCIELKEELLSDEYIEISADFRNGGASYFPNDLLIALFDLLKDAFDTRRDEGNVESTKIGDVDIKYTKYKSKQETLYNKFYQILSLYV